MARCRLIRPEFFTHEALYEAEASTGYPLRMAYAGLWCVADREGRFKWKPRTLKLAILPYDPVDFEHILMALVASGFIESYVVDGKQYGVIPSFLLHQTPHHREPKSSLPAPLKRRAPEKPGLNTGPFPSLPRPSLTDTETDTVTETDTEAVTETESVVGGSFEDKRRRIKSDILASLRSATAN